MSTRTRRPMKWPLYPWGCWALCRQLVWIVLYCPWEITSCEVTTFLADSPFMQRTRRVCVCKWTLRIRAGARQMPQHFTVLGVLAEALVLCPAPTSQLTTLWNSNPRASDSFCRHHLRYSIILKENVCVRSLKFYFWTSAEKEECSLGREQGE